MGSLSKWVRDIVLLVLYITFLEMLIPRGNMQKYVRLVTGLLVMLAIIRPIMSLVGGGFSLDGLLPFEEVGDGSMNQIIFTGQEIQRKGQEVVQGTSVAMAEGKIRGILMTFEDIEDSEVDLRASGGQISGARLQILLPPLETSKMQDLERRVKVVVGSFLDLSEEKIEVVFRRVDSLGAGEIL
jgi:stage III sporulation protein AF